MSGKYTEEELSGLSETERKALTDTEGDDDKDLEDIIGDDDDDDADDDGDDPDSDDDKGDNADDDPKTDDKGEGDDKGASDSAAPDANLSAVIGDFDPDSVPDITFSPKLSGNLLPEYEAKIDELDIKLDEGEISQAEHRKAVFKLQAESQNDEIAAQLWQAEQAAFFKANAEFRQATDAAAFDKLNKEVIRVANDPSNAGLSGIQMLYLAKHNLDEAKEFAEFKAFKAAKKAGNQEPEPDKKIPAKPSSRKPDQQTLRDVPAADNADVGQDKYSHLDKLSGVALEAAIAKMSPEEQEAYLMGA